MKIHFNGWFGGFIDKTNPGLHVDFFIELFEKIYKETCEIGTLENSDILCEFDMLLGSSSKIHFKTWKHTFLFSGESTLKCKKENYDCVLWGEKNHKNVINLPLFIPYIYTNKFVDTLENICSVQNFPKHNVLVIISNPAGKTRNKFIELLEQNFHVCYAGNYKNNIGGTFKPAYNSQEFRNFISQFKFMISMENSREDTYITEKIINPLLAGIIPVYWGSKYIYDYINKERFLCLENFYDEEEMTSLINKMKIISADQELYKQITNAPIFKNTKLERNIDIVANDIVHLLNENSWSSLSKIYCVNNPIFEPDRNKHLQSLFSSQNIPASMVSYISPTYKTTITEDIYTNNVKKQLVLNLRPTPMKKGELSLFLNYKAVLENIVKNYKDGIFLILESDVMIGKDISLFPSFIHDFKNKDWDIIHIGEENKQIWNNNPNLTSPTGYEKRVMYPYSNLEDITNSNDIFRLSRKFHTRCTDSFLWRYKAISHFLNYMNSNSNYGVPFDYYMCNYFEHNPSIKHYWSENEFFIQGSNSGHMQSTIQN